MTFSDFFNKYNGKAVEREDSSNLDQCFDLAFAWCDEQGIDRAAIRHLYAYQIFTQPTDTTRKYFDLIPNTRTGVPQSGDMVIFGTAVGFAGHVCIASGKGDTNTFESLDQNWDTAHFNMGKDPNTGLLIPYTRMVTHNYNFCLGWLRVRQQAPAQPQPATGTTQADLDAVRKARDDNWNLYQAEIQKTTQLTQRVAELTGAISVAKDALANANV